MAVPVRALKWLWDIGRHLQRAAPKNLRGAKWLKGTIGDDAILLGSRTRTVGRSREALGRLGGMQRLGKGRGALHGEARATKIAAVQRQRVGGAIGLGMIMGGGIAAIDRNPETDVFEGAVRGGAGLALWEVFGPTALLADHTTLSGHISEGATGISHALPNRRSDIATGMVGYIGAAGMDQYSGNLRRQALGFILRSRQNTRSFLGSEASALHREESY